MGFVGLQSAVVVEFDTWYDASLEDPFDNHISLRSSMTSGQPVYANHSLDLATSLSIPDLLDGQLHQVRVEYLSTFDSELLLPWRCGKDNPKLCDKVQIPPINYFQFDVRSLSQISVYLDDLTEPRFIGLIPRSVLGSTAYVGFTASTGAGEWQEHDIMSWRTCVENVCSTVL